MLFVEIFAFVKVVGEFELKTLANLVIILNRDASYVRAPHARASREREAFSRACFVALKSFAIEKPPVNTTTFWAAYGYCGFLWLSLFERICRHFDVFFYFSVITCFNFGFVDIASG